MDKINVYVGDSVIVELKNGIAFEGVIKRINFESLLMYDDLYGKDGVVRFDEIESLELL